MNGESRLATATFTRADGTTGDTSSLAFGQNAFYREFTDTIEVPEDVAALPQMQGSGAVRDLQEAAAQSDRLAGILEQYAAA